MATRRTVCNSCYCTGSTRGLCRRPLRAGIRHVQPPSRFAARPGVGNRTPGVGRPVCWSCSSSCFWALAVELKNCRGQSGRAAGRMARPGIGSGSGPRVNGQSGEHSAQTIFRKRYVLDRLLAVSLGWAGPGGRRLPARSGVVASGKCPRSGRGRTSLVGLAARSPGDRFVDGSGPCFAAGSRFAWPLALRGVITAGLSVVPGPRVKPGSRRIAA